MRKWREIHSLHFLILSLFLPSLYISYIKICHILSQNVKYGTFVANVTKNLHTRYEKITLGRIRCVKAPQVVRAWTLGRGFTTIFKLSCHVQYLHIKDEVFFCWCQSVVFNIWHLNLFCHLFAFSSLSAVAGGPSSQPEPGSIAQQPIQNQIIK